MSYLPTDTRLGDLRITEVIAYYDRPLLFTCQNEVDHLYLACLVDEADGAESWLYAEMSPRRWQHVRSGAMDLHDAFAKAEKAQVFRIRQDSQTGDLLSSIESVRCADLTEDELPYPGEYAELPQESHSPQVADNLRVRARQSQRTAIDLSLQSPLISRTEFPAKLLGGFLTAMQDIFAAIGQTIFGPSTARGPLPGRVQEFAELSVVGTGPGSFRVELSATPLRTLFDATDIDQALVKLSELLAATGNDELLKPMLTSELERVISRYADLLSQVVSSQVSARLDWYSPASDYAGHAAITIRDAQSTLGYLGTVRHEEEDDLHVFGVLEGFMLSSKKFELRTVDREKTMYHGDVADDALDDIRTAKLGVPYSATVHWKRIYSPLAPNPPTTYVLTRLASASLTQPGEQPNPTA